ncbi:MAG: S-layer homology domain-containing protein [Clostridia bacterium]|nr:S-layer homology domain-containing protein [Clostridia bacterium]
MKKLISLILCITMLLTTAVFAAYEDEKPWSPAYTKVDVIPRGNDVIARFVIGSDVHIGYTYSYDKLRNAFDTIGKMGGADAFLFAGDITEMGWDYEYDAFMDIATAYTKNWTSDVDGFTANTTGSSVDTVIIAAGNHEYYAYEDNAKHIRMFSEKTGQALDGLYWINGVPVIKLGMTQTSEEEVYYDKHDFIESALKEIDGKGYKGHIILLSHTPMGDTVMASSPTNEDGFSDATEALLKKYPQIIHVSGHSHYNPYSPKFIDQSAGFTSLSDGIIGKTIDDGFDESGKIGSFAVMLDVKRDGTTEVRRIDLQNGRVMFDGEDWILDASDTAEDFIYFADKDEAKNPDSYVLKASAPWFNGNEKISLRDMGDHDSVEITFPEAQTKTANNYDYVYSYTIKAIPKNGDGKTLEVRIPNNDHFPGGYGSDTITTVMTGFPWDVEYYFEIYAESCFGYKSNVIKSSDTVKVEPREVNNNTRVLYDIDYSYGTGIDLMGHKSDVPAFLAPKYQSDIDRYAVNFIGLSTNMYQLTEDVFDAMRYGFTLEAYVKMSYSGEAQEILGNYNYGGVAITTKLDTVCVRFNPKGADSGEFCRTSMPVDKWTHIVVTYDSQYITLYLNGEKAASEFCPGGLGAEFDTEVSAEEVAFNVGGRRRTGEDPSLLKNSSVNLIRMYAGTMTDEAVSDAYKTVTQPVKKFAFTDVTATDWFYEPVLYSFATGLMSGTSDTLFAPATQTSRAMIVQLLYNMEGRPAVDASNNPFTDVPYGEWYAPAVLWAYQNGVTAGTGATTFSPDTLVTREQVAVFLYRYMKDYKKAEMAEGADLSSFVDADQISPYAGFAEAVSWANSTGIVTGKRNNTLVLLAPQDKAQRSETATMFARFHKVFVR